MVIQDYNRISQKPMSQSFAHWFVLKKHKYMLAFLWFFDPITYRCLKANQRPKIRVTAKTVAIGRLFSNMAPDWLVAVMILLIISQISEIHQPLFFHGVWR